MSKKNEVEKVVKVDDRIIMSQDHAGIGCTVSRGDIGKVVRINYLCINHLHGALYTLEFPGKGVTRAPRKSFDLAPDQSADSKPQAGQEGDYGGVRVGDMKKYYWVLFLVKRQTFRNGSSVCKERKFYNQAIIDTHPILYCAEANGKYGNGYYRCEQSKMVNEKCFESFELMNWKEISETDYEELKDYV